MITTQDILLFIEGKASAELATRINAWLAADQANQKMLNLYQEMWRQASEIKDYRLASVSQGWAALEPSITEAPVVKRQPWGQYLLGSLLVILSALLVWKLTTPSPYVDIRTNLQQSDTIVLADGSRLFIAPNTHVRYPRYFSDPTQRKIQLFSGQAYLMVSADPQRPFYLDLYPAGIKVLGTIFEASSDSSVARVANREGLIRFFDLQDETKGVDVKEGESFSFDGQAFTNETPKPEPPPPPPPRGKMLSIPFIIEFMQYNYPRSVIFKPYLHLSQGRVRLDINQSLSGMIQQLDSTAIFEYSERNGVFYINQFQPLPLDKDSIEN